MAQKSASLRNWRRRLRGVRIHVGLLMVCAGFLLPFAWMVSTSLKREKDTAQERPQFLPSPVEPGNYLKVVNNAQFNVALLTRNTLIVAALTVAGTTLSSALAAYGFAKLRFRGRGGLFAVTLVAMMVPFPVTMTPLFLMFKWLGTHTEIEFLGTFKPLWLPAWFGSAFNIFLLRQFFLTIPDELSEAARIDGCTDWGIFWRIVLPLSKPALTVVAVFTFMAVWNDYLGPLIYLQHPDQYTLALGLQAFLSQHGGTPWNLLMAASVLVLSPMLILFFLMQRTFVQGIATTGLKG